MNGAKTWLVTTEEHLEEAQHIFKGTKVNIIVGGKQHLVGALGTREFTTASVSQQVSSWVGQVN